LVATLVLPCQLEFRKRIRSPDKQLITVPTVINSGQPFPLTTRYPFGFSVERRANRAPFGSLDAKQEQITCAQP
jgi:hypothetical protein